MDAFHHINVSATDIEKYHRGELSAQQMHALEKAALDDPFLADALEGYQGQSSIPGDIKDLQQRLATRIASREKVVPLFTGRSNRSWWRVAAILLLVAGAGYAVYSGLNNGKNDHDSIAQVKVDRPATNDSALMDNAPPQTNADTAASSNLVNRPTAASSPTIAPATAPGGQGAGKSSQPPVQVPVQETAKFDNKALQDAPAVGSIASRKMAEEKKIHDSVSAPTATTGYFTKTENNNQNLSNRSNQNLATSKASPVPTFKSQHYNYFRGRITDANRNALPFANVTSLPDNVGTYSDAKGNFVLISPDSVLDVQVRSLGYADNNIQLKSADKINRVTMKDDTSSLAGIVIGHKKINIVRPGNDNMQLGEAEPADGWTNYDTYLSNNIVTPETFPTKPTGAREVQLSFQVDQLGKPVDIKVVHSLCEACDREAIRLLKEGPAWKRKKGKRTTVSISF